MRAISCDVGTETGEGIARERAPTFRTVSNLSPVDSEVEPAVASRDYFPPMLNTETPSGRHPDLDLYATIELIRAFTEDQVFAANVVHAAAPQIARAVDAAAPRIGDMGEIEQALQSGALTVHTKIITRRKTVDAENADRMALMKSDAEKQKSSLPQIQTKQAALAAKLAFKGEWIEVVKDDGSAEWIQKEG